MRENLTHHVTLFMQQDNARGQVREQLIDILIKNNYAALDSACPLELTPSHVAALESVVHLLRNLSNSTHQEEQGTS